MANILQNGSWQLPQSNHDDVILLRRKFDDMPIPTAANDRISWCSMDINGIKASHIWESIRNRQQIVSWDGLLWNKLHVPRYSFILWLGLLRKLPMSDRAMFYSAGPRIGCMLCNLHVESFEHLFFKCDYSSNVFRAAMNLGNWQNFPLEWADLIDSILDFQGRGLTKNIISLTLAMTFYKVWEARNKKFHQNVFTPPTVLGREVVNIIKSRLSQSRSFIKATHVDQYYCNWLL